MFTVPLHVTLSTTQKNRKNNTDNKIVHTNKQKSNMDDELLAPRDGRRRERRYKVLPDPLRTPSLSPSSSSEPPSPLTPSPPRPSSPKKKKKKKIDHGPWTRVDAIMNRPTNHTGYWYTSNPVDRRSTSPPPPPRQQERWLFHTNGPATTVQRWQESLYGGGGRHQPPPPPYNSGCRHPPTPSSRRQTPPPAEPEPVRYGSSSLEFSWPNGWDK